MEMKERDRYENKEGRNERTWLQIRCGVRERDNI